MAKYGVWFILGSLGLLGAVSAAIAESGSSAQTVFVEDFEHGLGRWELIDASSWALQAHGMGQSLSITQRESQYQPKVRSPLHIALVKELKVGDFEITFRVKSTKNTGNHRDCCIFFNYQDPTHFYYVHLGAKPDPASADWVSGPLNCHEIELAKPTIRSAPVANRRCQEIGRRPIRAKGPVETAERL